MRQSEMTIAALGCPMRLRCGVVSERRERRSEESQSSERERSKQTRAELFAQVTGAAATTPAALLAATRQLP